MWEFLLQVDNTTSDGGTINISDISDWSLADNVRDAFGVFIVGEYRLSSTPSEVSIATYDPLAATTWTATSSVNGRYTFKAYAFYEKDFVVPVEGDVHIDVTDKLLYQWTAGAWVLISLTDAIAQAKYHYVSTTLEVPLLSYAYAYKNKLTLDYIAQVKGDMAGGADQNKLYYKRNDLDYFRALIHSAEYNWSLDLYSNFYEVVGNLNDIINTEKIS